VVTAVLVVIDLLVVVSLVDAKHLRPEGLVIVVEVLVEIDPVVVVAMRLVIDHDLVEIDQHF